MPRVGYDLDGVVAIPTRPLVYAMAKATNLKKFWTAHNEGCTVGMRPKVNSVIITARPIKAHFETWIWMREHGISVPLIMAPGFLPDVFGRAYYKALAIKANGIELYWEDTPELAKMISRMCPYVNVRLYKGKIP